MERHAITFRIQPGSEQIVTQLLSSYESPATEIDATTRLLGTTVFHKDGVIVRVMDIEGDLLKVMMHLGVQPQIQEVERSINPHLVEERELTPAGFAAFFANAGMEQLLHRVNPMGDPAKASRYGLLYPLKPGVGGKADAAFKGGGDPPPQAGASKLVSTSVFRKGDLVVRVFEIDGTIDEAIEHLVRATALFDAGASLAPFLSDDVDLTTEAGLRDFFTRQMMDVVTDRRL